MTPVRMTPTTLSLAPLLTMARSPPVMLKCWPVFSSVRIRQLGSTPSSTVPTTVRRAPAAVVDGGTIRLGVVRAVRDGGVCDTVDGAGTAGDFEGATGPGVPPDGAETPAALEPISDDGAPVAYEALTGTVIVNDVA